MQTLPSLDGLISSVATGAEGPLAQLGLARSMADQLGGLGEGLLNRFVADCRRSGQTWTEIGEQLGVTRQAAQQRFMHRDPNPEPIGLAQRVWNLVSGWNSTVPDSEQEGSGSMPTLHDTKVN